MGGRQSVALIRKLLDRYLAGLELRIEVVDLIPEAKRLLRGRAIGFDRLLIFALEVLQSVVLLFGAGRPGIVLGLFLLEHSDQGRAGRHDPGNTEGHPADRTESRVKGDSEGGNRWNRDLRHESKAGNADRHRSDSDHHGAQGLHDDRMILREPRRHGQGARPQAVQPFDRGVEILADHNLEVGSGVLHFLLGVRRGVGHGRVGRLSRAEGVLHGVQSRIELLRAGVV